jgi:hypothetical protein
MKLTSPELARAPPPTIAGAAIAPASMQLRLSIARLEVPFEVTARSPSIDTAGVSVRSRVVLAVYAMEKLPSCASIRFGTRKR